MGGGKRGKKKKNRVHSSGGTVSPQDNKKTRQNQDWPYLFTNLQLLCNGLIADSWLHGKDKAFRERTVLICSAEQMGHILVRQKQAAHLPTTICKGGKLSGFLQREKIMKKKKPLLQHTKLLPSHPAPAGTANYHL